MKTYAMTFTQEEMEVLFWALNSYGVDWLNPDWERDMADELMMRVNNRMAIDEY